MLTALWIRLRNLLRKFPRFFQFLKRLWGSVLRYWLLPFRFLPSWLDFGPPRGWFSIVDELRAGKVQGKIILERQPDPHITPESLRVKAPLGQQTQLVWPIFWTRHPNARLIGSTLLLCDAHKRVGLESAYGRICIKDDIGYRQFRRPPPRHLEGPWTSIVSRWQNTFHHWMYDTLPRLALLSEFPPETRILVQPDLTRYERESLALFGLEERLLSTGHQHFIIEDYYFASPTNMTGLFNPFALKFLRSALLNKADLSYQSPRRFFIHRAGATRGLLNETEVLQFFRDRGWGIVDTQALSMAQQIQLFAQAEYICAPHGAALTHLVWCHPGTPVLELLASNYLNGVFEGISEAGGLDYRFLLCKADLESRIHVDIAELKKHLDDRTV